MSNLPEKQSPKPFEDQVSDYLAAMCATLKTYGKNFSLPLLQGWMIVLTARQVTPAELSAGVEHFLTGTADMPTPGEFVSWVSEQRERQESAERLRATYENEKRLSQQYRAALVANGFDPDALLPTGPIIAEIRALSGTLELPAPSLSDPAQEAKIREQIAKRSAE